MHRSYIPWLVLSSVVAVFTGGAAAAAAHEPAAVVTVSVDGRQRAVQTTARTVGAVLDEQSVRVGPHDSLVPARDAAVDDDAMIVVRHGRLLHLTIGEQSREAWVTAPTLSDALAEIGVRADEAYVSAPPDQEIPLDGLEVAVRLPQRVLVLADGHVQPVVTTAPTVGDVLGEAGVVLGAADSSSVAVTSYPADGMVVQITRIRGSRLVEDSPIPFPILRRPDPAAYVGTVRVVAEGTLGVLQRMSDVTTTDGQVTGKQFVGEVVAVAPQPRVELFGTRPIPPPPPRPPAPVHRVAATVGADGLNWYALAQCESGNNPRAVSASGTYRGLYQFSLGTWHSVGGAGDPINASRDEQTYRAKLLYQRAGRSPWPVCGSRL